MGPFLSGLVERLSAGGAQRKPKIAKGARDFLPEQVRYWTLPSSSVVRLRILDYELVGVDRSHPPLNVFFLENLVFFAL